MNDREMTKTEIKSACEVLASDYGVKLKEMSISEQHNLINIFMVYVNQ